MIKKCVFEYHPDANGAMMYELGADFDYRLQCHAVYNMLARYPRASYRSSLIRGPAEPCEGTNTNKSKYA